MICPRHDLPIRFEGNRCLGCFGEVLDRTRITDADVVRAIAETRRSVARLTSADALIRRLGGH